MYWQNYHGHVESLQKRASSNTTIFSIILASFVNTKQNITVENRVAITGCLHAACRALHAACSDSAHVHSGAGHRPLTLSSELFYRTSDLLPPLLPRSLFVMYGLCSISMLNARLHILSVAVHVFFSHFHQIDIDFKIITAPMQPLSIHFQQVHM